MGRRDRRLGPPGHPAREAGAQRRRRDGRPVARAQGALRQGLGQPGCDRGSGRPHRETATELPGGLTVMAWGSLRLAAGTASLAAGSWLLRALHGAPSPLGADPASIREVAGHSPNYRDGVFVNLDPVSGVKKDSEQLRLVAWEMV